jgi:triosephosphate isomerase
LKIFFPPLPFLHLVSKKIGGTSGFYCGAQNCSEHISGAYTGETSAAMIASTGCKYVLVGHSERRQYFGENNSICATKIQRALENNLYTVYCIGEKIEERKANKHFEVVEMQLKEALKGLNSEQLKNIILAYEPVWAIGTGETASPEQAQEMHAFIRTTIKNMFGEATSESISILYGGSCNAQNAKDLFSCADVDGGLIGGASLKADDFCKIIASF